MEKKMLIEGMMCVRCKANVEKTLRNIPGVTDCVVNLEEKTARITLDAEVSDVILMTAVSAKGYKPVQML